MKNFKIIYLLGGDIRNILLKAKDSKTALVGFYQNFNCDEVIKVVELNV